MIGCKSDMKQGDPGLTLQWVAVKENECVFGGNLFSNSTVNQTMFSVSFWRLNIFFSDLKLYYTTYLKLVSATLRREGLIFLLGCAENVLDDIKFTVDSRSISFLR